MLYKGFKEKAAIVTIAILATPIHELGHWIGYKVNGISAVLHYNYTDSLANTDNIWGIAGGPIMSLSVALVCLVMMYFNKRNEEVWAYFSLIMCMTRILPYIICIFNPNTFLYNDEGLIGKALGIEIWLIYSVFSILFLGITFFIIRRLIRGIDEYLRNYKFGYILYLILTITIGIKIN